MEDITYEDAIEMYYSLKNRYNKKYKALKGKIINDTELSLKQKQKKIKKIKMPCIHCKAMYGSIFEDKNRILSVVCGNTQEPCKLNIRIKKPSVINIRDNINVIKEEIHEDKYNILRLKLSFLFGFMNEDELTQLFEDVKEKYDENVALLDLVLKLLEDSTQEKEREENLRVLNVEKYNTVNTIQNTMREFLATNNSNLVNDSVNILIDELDEIIENIRNNKYQEMYVETHTTEYGNTVRLIQNKNSLKSLEYNLEDGEVLNFDM